MANSLEVVFRGDIVPGENLMAVRERLRELFKADDQQLARLFSGRPVVIRKGLDQEGADRYRQAMNQAGAVVEVRSGSESSATPVSPISETRQTPEVPPAATEPASAESEPASSDPQWGIAPVGADVLNDNERRPEVEADVNTSHISLAPEGSDVLKEDERQPSVERQVDTSHLSLDNPG